MDVPLLPRQVRPPNLEESEKTTASRPYESTSSLGAAADGTELSRRHGVYSSSDDYVSIEVRWCLSYCAGPTLSSVDDFWKLPETGIAD
jgi:hypothetical protein